MKCSKNRCNKKAVCLWAISFRTIDEGTIEKLEIYACQEHEEGMQVARQKILTFIKETDPTAQITTKHYEGS